jgi:hypothetical protein
MSGSESIALRDGAVCPRTQELQRVGFELYHRCEQWKKALTRIQQLTDDPAILRVIKTTLEG